MISKEWRPENLEGFFNKWGHLHLPADGHMDLADAARLQIQFQQYADELGDHLAQALFYEEMCKYARNNSRTMGRLRSEAKTDKGKDDEANGRFEVMEAEKKYIEANAYRILLTEKHQSAIRSHYAAKAYLGWRGKEENI